MKRFFFESDYRRRQRMEAYAEIAFCSVSAIASIVLLIVILTINN